MVSGLFDWNCMSGPGEFQAPASIHRWLRSVAGSPRCGPLVHLKEQLVLMNATNSHVGAPGGKHLGPVDAIPQRNKMPYEKSPEHF
jgi:hypothetical protein